MKTIVKIDINNETKKFKIELSSGQEFIIPLASIKLGDSFIYNKENREEFVIFPSFTDESIIKVISKGLINKNMGFAILVLIRELWPESPNKCACKKHNPSFGTVYPIYCHLCKVDKSINLISALLDKLTINLMFDNIDQLLLERLKINHLVLSEWYKMILRFFKLLGIYENKFQYMMEVLPGSYYQRFVLFRYLVIYNPETQIKTKNFKIILILPKLV